jgi:magnesium-transporting ATPase (P-type)
VGIVIFVGDNTVIGRIAGLAANAETTETPLHKDIQFFNKILSGIAIA